MVSIQKGRFRDGCPADIWESCGAQRTSRGKASVGNSKPCSWCPREGGSKRELRSEKLWFRRSGYFWGGPGNSWGTSRLLPKPKERSSGEVAWGASGEVQGKSGKSRQFPGPLGKSDSPPATCIATASASYRIDMRRNSENRRKIGKRLFNRKFWRETCKIYDFLFLAHVSHTCWLSWDSLFCGWLMQSQDTQKLPTISVYLEADDNASCMTWAVHRKPNEAPWYRRALEGLEVTVHECWKKMKVPWSWSAGDFVLYIHPPDSSPHYRCNLCGPLERCRKPGAENSRKRFIERCFACNFFLQTSLDYTKTSQKTIDSTNFI